MRRAMNVRKKDKKTDKKTIERRNNPQGMIPSFDP